MEYLMTREEKKCWMRELERTEYWCICQELKEKGREFSPEYRRYLKERREELREKYGFTD